MTQISDYTITEIDFDPALFCERSDEFALKCDPPAPAELFVSYTMEDGCVEQKYSCFQCYCHVRDIYLSTNKWHCKCGNRALRMIKVGARSI